MRSRVVIAALVASALVLAGVAGALAFGLPGRVAAPAAPVAGEASSDAAPPAVPPPDPRSPLHTDIPGCVCHSPDPAIVAEHKAYRMNQCFGCHRDGMPAMGGG